MEGNASSIIFVGSNFLFRRKVETQYKAEMAKQWYTQMRQLHRFFIALVEDPDENGDNKWNLQGAALGVRVLEYITRNFRAQKREGANLSEQQKSLYKVAKESLHMIKHLKIAEGNSTLNCSTPVPLIL